MYHPPHCPTSSLLELADLVSDVILESSILLLLGAFNIHAESAQDKPVPDFLATMSTLDLSQVISGSTHLGGHMLDLVFCSGSESGGQ